MLKLWPEGETEIHATRDFAAPPRAVWHAHVSPEILRDWLLGPDGWHMPVCLCDPRPGGRMLYEWADGNGNGFRLTGEFLALQPFSHMVHVERMHLPDPTPDNRVETWFAETRHGTRMTMVMALPDAATRDAMLATGMAAGMEASYARLDRLLAAGV